MRGSPGRGPTRRHPDLKEVFHLGPPDFPHDAYHSTPEARPHFVDNVWPAAPADFRAAVTAYYRATEQLAADLMRMFALALGLPEHFFADKTDRHISALRIINYPSRRAHRCPDSCAPARTATTARSPSCWGRTSRAACRSTPAPDNGWTC